VWLISLRDLQWRRRRFAIAVLGASLVFSLTVLMSGLSSSFRSEARRTLAAFGADAWVIARGSPGPFTTLTTLPDAAARDVARRPGVARAQPVIIFHQVVRSRTVRDVNVIGHVLGGLGSPPVTEGRAVARAGEAVVGTALNAKLGTTILLGGRRFVVVGRAKGMSFNGGLPNVYVSLKDAQALAFGGAPLVGAIVTKGVPGALPAGLTVMTNQGALDDMLRPLKQSIRSIDILQGLLWIVAAMIIGSVIYLSALERGRDFAVMKATGSSSRSLLAGLSMQAVLLSLAAAVIAIGLARVLRPLFPVPLAIPARAVLFLPVIALIVGLLASISAIRRAVSVDPALAFGGP
jgi:putative ABC transport system permease protein